MGTVPCLMTAGGAATSSLRLMRSAAASSVLLRSTCKPEHVQTRHVNASRSFRTCASMSTSSTESSPERPATPQAIFDDAQLRETELSYISHLSVGRGSMDLIIGPMFAGKSTELLRRVRLAHAAGRQAVLVKSSKDTRYAPNDVTTHTGDRLPCTPSDCLMPLLADEAFMAHDVIAVDEAQFFPDLLHFVVEAVEQHNKSVLIAGLDGDYKRLKFGQILDLIPLADSVTKLNGKCNYCDSKSIHSFRVVADERQELVGGADKYVPTCRFHYVSLSSHRHSRNE